MRIQYDMKKYFTPAETRLLDQAALRFWVDQPGNGGDAEVAYREALKLIEARRETGWVFNDDK